MVTAPWIAPMRLFSVVGLASTPEDSTLCAMLARNACWRCSRSMSVLPPGMLYRCRTNSNAWTPCTVKSPAGNTAPDFCESFTAWLRHTGTPPMALEIWSKPIRLTAA